MEGTSAATSGVVALERLLAVLPSFGVDGADVCRVVGVELAALRRRQRVPVTIETAIWTEAARRRPDLPLGIAAAERCFALGIHESTLYEYLGCFAPTLRDASAAMCARQRLETDAFVTTFVETDDRCVARVEPVSPHVDVSWDRVEFGMLRMLKEARRLTDCEPTPLQVSLRRADDRHREAFERAFGAPVDFGAAHDTMSFGLECLDSPLLRSNPPLHAEIVRIADQELASLAPAQQWPVLLATVERLVIEGDLSAAAVAGWMGVSSEALHRLIRERGLSWNEVVDSIRRPRAERLLRDPSVGVAEVGYQLGFASPASFTRAFRRWTGMSPEEFRRST
ncbi:MAG: AraC family transcriptional regulator ligand-binding domain-containing protein [Kofleriaceae bacterium]